MAINKDITYLATFSIAFWCILEPRTCEPARLRSLFYISKPYI